MPGVLSVMGETTDTNKVFQAILEDREFYVASGGGVTISGGEPTCQLDFTCEILSRCRDAGIHTAVESNLCCSNQSLERLLPLVDLVMADLKCMDAEKHRQATGQSNRRILENLCYLGQTKKPLILRTPVIHGFNDTEEEIKSIAAFAATIPSLRYYELLRYHPLGCRKAEQLGMERYAQARETISNKTWQTLVESAFSTGITLLTNGRK